MIKLYRRLDGVLLYHAAWSTGRVITEHWGIVGERGDRRELRAPRFRDATRSLERVLQIAVQDGYEPWPQEQLAGVLVEYVIDGSTAADLEKREDLEQRLDETLGWTGLGRCDGGSIGGGTMKVLCLVVDAEIAVRVIEDDLIDSPFGDYARVVEA